MITLCSVADTMIVGLFSHACVPGRAVSLTPPTGRPTRGSFREASIPGPGAVFGAGKPTVTAHAAPCPPACVAHAGGCRLLASNSLPGAGNRALFP